MSVHMVSSYTTSGSWWSPVRPFSFPHVSFAWQEKIGCWDHILLDTLWQSRALCSNHVWFLEGKTKMQVIVDSWTKLMAFYDCLSWQAVNLEFPQHIGDPGLPMTTQLVCILGYSLTNYKQVKQPVCIY